MEAINQVASLSVPVNPFGSIPVVTPVVAWKVVPLDFQIVHDLDLNQVTPVEFTPKTPGKYPFTCHMNMFRGEVEVRGRKWSKWKD